MKKKWIALIVFALVFVVEILLRKYSLIWAENLSLFLFTPDYFAKVFSEPFPIFHLFKSFLIQFFGLHPLGPVIVALLISGLYMVLCWLLRLSGIGKKPYSAVILAGAVVLSVAVSALLPSSRRHETLCKVMLQTKNHDWYGVLNTATPEKCKKNRDLLPFALLALQNKDMMAEHLFDYPLRSIGDMDYQGSDMVVGHFFDAMLAESLEVINDVIHNVFQLNCGRPYGTCFLSLHLLVRNALAQGNYRLAMKYSIVLGKSPRFASEAKRILALCNGETETFPSTNTSGKAVLQDKNPIVNLIMLSAAGKGSKLSRDRFVAYQILSQRFGEDPGVQADNI